MKILSKPAYEESLAASRDERMKWWREARYGMFVHIGLYSVLKRHEWAMVAENWDATEYAKLADQFLLKEGAPLAWARLAREAGMKYMVMTTRHHEGFSLWDSKVNPFNSVNYGPRRDIVREFVDACRECGLRIGFYSSLMDWRHPDAGAAAYDGAARKRFTDYIYEMNRELFTSYGKIDILWYDVADPMEHGEGWNSVERNQRLRELQPDIIINNRSRIDEDFGTPEEKITALDRDWEACMTFNGISWGYVDSAQARAHSYNAQGILGMLSRVTAGGGNLLLNIGPDSDGSIPAEVFEPLRTVGKWLEVNGEAVYGSKQRGDFRYALSSSTLDDRTVYLWNWIWPSDGEMILGGAQTRLKRVRLLGGGELKFVQEPQRVIVKGLPKESPDSLAGVAVLAMEYEGKPVQIPASRYPMLHKGRDYSEVSLL